MFNNSFNNRALALINVVKANNENSWSSINSGEITIVNNAAILRKLFKKLGDNFKYVQKTVSSVDWLLGLECLTFLIEHKDNLQMTTDIIIAIQNHDSDLKTGMLDRIYVMCDRENIPASWAANTVMNLAREEKNLETEKFVINPKGFKL